MSEMSLPLPLLGFLLFTIMGPIGLIPMFASATVEMEAGTKVRKAVSACAIAIVTLAIAVFAGASAMERVGTSRASLIIAAGLILTLTSLRSVLGMSSGSSHRRQMSSGSEGMPLTTIAIPGIVSPISVAVLVIFASYFPTIHDKLVIMGLVAAIMIVNLIALLAADLFMRSIGTAPLIVLGAVFGVLQVALGIEMIFSGLGRLIGGPSLG